MDAGRPVKMESQTALWPWLLLFFATALCFLPFCGKAFHIDDTLFVWAAKHIQSHPGNPYGFAVNWYGSEMPMSEVTKNPPLNSYFIAGAALFGGWSETALHLAFLVPALAVIFGTYRLAGFFCKNQLHAALLTLFSPAFLVSGSTVMCDVPMLAFWIWAIVFWMQGMEENSPWRLVLASILIALSSLTKYYGMSLIPLLAAYSIYKRRGIGWWMAYLLIPAFVLACYQHATHTLYGRGLLLDAGEYAAATREGYGATFVPKTLVGLAFLGGSVAAVFAYAFFFWSKKRLAFGAACIAGLILILSYEKRISGFALANQAGEVQWLMILQIGIFAAGGAGLALLAASDFLRRRDAGALLLVLWILGTLVFAAYVNWTVNARSILPLLPAASILLMRRLEDSRPPLKSKPHTKKKKIPAEPPGFPAPWMRLTLPMIPAAVLALLVSYADYKLAGSARAAAGEIRKQYSQDRVFFEGHWGFQYYMESLKGVAIDFQNTENISVGDLLVVPVNNTNTTRGMIPENIAAPLPELQFTASRWLSTMNSAVGAGFYAELWGPLPYAFGAAQPERYRIYRIKAAK